MKNLPIFFVSGLPRSGSTLLMNLLGQCNNHHVTPTNDLIEMILKIRDTWQDNISFKSQGLNKVKPRIINSMKAMVWGFYSKEFLDGKIIFDKSRGWIANIELIEEILQRPIKVIVTIRDIRSIACSFEKKLRESQLTKPSYKGDTFFDMQSIEGRTKQLLHVKSVLGLSITRFRDALDRGLRDRLIIVPYKDLTTNTVDTMNMIHKELGIKEFNGYDPNNVLQITHEDDSVHGMELHKIEKKVVYKKENWSKILTPILSDWISNEYKDINILCNEQ